MDSNQLVYKINTIAVYAKTQVNYWLTEEGSLIRQAKNGDQQAWRKLIKRHQDAVYATAYRFLLSHDDALEASQETFIAVYMSIKTFKGQSLFRTWVVKIAIRVSIKMVKAKKAWIELENKNVADSDSFDDNFAQREEITRALLHLPDDLRAVIILREYNGFSYLEIADSLGIALGTVESRLFRARKKLQKLLTQGENDV